MSYVIRNCPAKDFGYKTCSNSDKPCKDIPNCLLKQIVELCKKARNERDLAFLKIKFTGAEIAKLYGKVDFAKEILELLEIEEVDE